MIGIEIADVYINFPEIMKEEYKDLWEFINDEHIVAKDVTKDIINLKQRINKATELLERRITFCENDSYGAYEVCNIAINNNKELLSILKGGSEND